MAARLTVPASHLVRLSCGVMYGIRSSVPGMTHPAVWPTHHSSTSSRSITFITHRITSICQNPVQKPRAPLTAYTHTST